MNLTTSSTIASVASTINGVANKGAWTGSITSSGGSITVPKGYHNGSGKVTGPTLATLVGSNVTLISAGSLLSGVTAYGKDGTKYTGSMVNRSTTIQTATTSTSDSSKSCYRTGNGYIDVIPALGYWGSWDWNKSYIRVPSTVTFKTLSGTYTPSSSTYNFKNNSGNNASAYYLSIPMNYTHRVIGAYYICTSNSNNWYICTSNGYLLENEIKWRYELARSYSDWNTKTTLYLPTRNENTTTYSVTVWYI